MQSSCVQMLHSADPINVPATYARNVMQRSNPRENLLQVVRIIIALNERKLLPSNLSPDAALATPPATPTTTMPPAVDSATKKSNSSFSLTGLVNSRARNRVLFTMHC